MSRSVPPALIFLFVAVLSSSHATVVVDDPFTDGSFTNTTGGDALGLVYYRSTTSAGAPLAVNGNSDIGSGNALLFSPNADGQKYFANFPSTTLAGAGESIRVTLDFQFTSAPSNASDGFRIGLFNSNGTRQSSDGGGTIRNDDKGYAIAFNPVATSYSIRKEDSGDDILGGTVYFASLTTSTNGTMAACGTTKHTLTLLMVRQANGDIAFTAQFDGLSAARGTLAAASVLTYTLDEFGIGFAPSGSVFRPFYLDNLRVVHGSAGSVALTAPAADSTFALPATVTLTASATDPDGVARVDFYDGTTKVGQATSSPYSLAWTNPGPGVRALSAVLIDNDGEDMVSAPVDIRTTGGTPDEFDTLRGRWLTQITGGSSYNLGDPDIAGRVNAITSGAQANWNTLLKTGGNGRAYLWSDAASSTDSADLTTCYGRLRSLALAYGTTGSTLQGNASLLADIAGGLDWMNANRYSENVTPYDNWYDWEIGAPQNLNDIVVLLYDQLTPTQLMNQMRAIERFDPTAEQFTFSNLFNTGANRADKDRLVAVRGVIVKDSAKLFAARDSVSPLLAYTPGGLTTQPYPGGDGYYADGSFIQHIAHPYNGAYGADLINSLGLTLAMLQNSTWAVTDSNLPNLCRYIYDSYLPFLFRGAMMDCVRGRDMSRSGDQDHARGHVVIGSILRIADFAPAADALNYRRAAKALIQADTSRNFLTNNVLPTVLRAKSVLADSSVTPSAEPVIHRHFAGMDRVVHWRPGFAFALSMSSSRIYNYESINGENLHGWYHGDGATYLYNSDIDEYSSNYWATVNPYRPAGVTVDTQTRANGASQSTYSSKSWAGGAEIFGLYGAAGMELQASGSTLTARKSWFMFDTEIVALGSGISSTDNRTIETVIENRRLKDAASALVVDGVSKPTTPGWNETMSGVGWCHLAATGGYVFPGGATIKGLRESRSGRWSDVNDSGTTTLNTNHFATLWFDHGSNPSGSAYGYILLPNQTPAQTAAYAAAPDVVVLENTSTAHGVRKKSLSLVGGNFWEDGSHTVGFVTVNQKSSVLVRETASQVDVAVSDPTQLNSGTIIVELARSATGVVSSDAQVSVLQLSPTIRFAANVNGAFGGSIKASFAVPDVLPPSIAPPSGGFGPGVLVSGAGGVVALPDYTGQAVVDDNVSVTSVTQSPASGSARVVGITHVTLTAHDTAANTSSTSFDVTVNDGTPPAITVLGANPASVPAENTYPDAGATATDNVDGSVAVTPSGTVNTQQTGTYAITYTAVDVAGNVGTATRTVTVISTAHYAWRQSVFGAQAGDPAITGDLMDPNGNGLVNLLEYALGGAPLGNLANPSVLPISGRDSNAHSTLTFSRFASRSDLTLTVQGADSPAGPWTDLAQSSGGGPFAALVAGVSVQEPGAGDPRVVTVSDAFTIGDSSHPRRFLRLKAAR